MAESPNLGSRKLAQVAFVTRDIVAAKRRWAEMLGVSEPEVIVTEPGLAVNASFQGAPTDAKAKLAFFDLGGVQLELIEPIGEESAWYQVLADHGEGFHHLAFWVEGMDRSKTFLDSRGIPMMQRGDMGDGQYAYFDGREQLGTVLELLEHRRSPLK